MGPRQITDEFFMVLDLGNDDIKHSLMVSRLQGVRNDKLISMGTQFCQTGNPIRVVYTNVSNL